MPNRSLQIPPEVSFADLEFTLNEETWVIKEAPIKALCQAQGWDPNEVISDHRKLFSLMVHWYCDAVENGEPRDPAFDRYIFDNEIEIAMHERKVMGDKMRLN